MCGLASFAVAGLGWLAGVDARAYDLALRSRPPLPRSESIAIVEIDDLTIDRLGRWPWPWSHHARFVRVLHEQYQPAAIVFDLLFAEVDPRDTEHRFADAIREAGNVYIAAFFSDIGETTAPDDALPRLEADYVGKAEWKGRRFACLRLPVRELAQAAAGVGPVNVVPELDGSLRRIPLVVDHGGNAVVSLTGTVLNALVNGEGKPVRVELGRAVTFGRWPVPIDHAGETLISYSRPTGGGPRAAFDLLRYEDVLERRAPEGALTDRVVLVGFGAAGIADVRPTPLAAGMLGVEVNAHALNGMLQESFLRVAGWPARLAFALMVGGLVALAAGRWSPGQALAVGLLLGSGGVVFAGAMLWYRGIWLGIAAPMLAGGGGYAAALSQRHRDRERESLRIQASVGTLATATRVIASVRLRAELLAEIRAQISDVLGARQTNLYLMDADGERLELAVPPQAQLQPVSYAVGEGTVGWVARDMGSHLVTRVAPGSGLQRELARVIPFAAGSAIHGPMRHMGQVMGVIEAVRGVGEEPFDQGHLSMLAALAGECAVALENMTLYEQLEGKVEIANRQLVAAYAELKQERDRVAAIVSNMADGVLVTDGDGVIAFVNPAAATMFGVDADEVLGKPAAEALPFPPLLAQLESEPVHDSPQIPRIRLEQPKRLVVSPRTVRLTDSEGERVGAITVVSDITLLEELSEMKTEFVSLVSHELRTPLTSIMGFAQTLRGAQDTIPASDHDEFLGIIEQESNRLVVMINDLLDVSRMEAGRPLPVSYERVDLKELVEHVIRFQQVTTDRHRFRMEIAGDGLYVEVDRDKVVQILTNLVSNAIKYSPQGGDVVIGGSEQGDMVVVYVRDRGVGMSEEVIAKLFEPYQRVDRDAIKGIRGTGLGLYLVRGLVQAHGGEIWVDSSPGSGSTFHFSLPKQRLDRQAPV